jgi:hypothetical protein
MKLEAQKIPKNNKTKKPKNFQCASKQRQVIRVAPLIAINWLTQYILDDI